MSYGTVQAEKMTTESGYSLGAGNASSFKNRIINGDMRIAQRTTSSIVVNNDENFPVDRTNVRCNTAGISATTQQSTSVVPSNFRYSIAVNVTTGAAAGSTDRGYVLQKIEGNNVADFLLGTASAVTWTFSFWVRSSLTGTFSGAFQNQAQNRSFIFTYTISAANTWEQKTVTVVGDTTGTWETGSGSGLFVQLDLGMGSSLRTSTTGSWVSGDFRGQTGATSLFANSGATFYTTGWQVEIGTVATSFDYRSYGTELDLCCRYYYKNVAFSTYSPIGVGRAWSGTNGNAPFFLPVPMRANQTVTYSALTDFDIVTLGNPSAIGNDGSSMNAIKIGWSRGSGVVSGNLYQIEYGNTTSAWLAFSAEL